MNFDVLNATTANYRSMSQNPEASGGGQDEADHGTNMISERTLRGGVKRS
jgi:hypothetical protein